MEKDILDELAGQFEKHLVTKVLPLIKSEEGVLSFYNNGVKSPAPILDYHLAGSWFTPDRIGKIMARYNEILKDPRLKKILKAEPEFKFESSNIINGDLLPSIIN